MRMAELKPELQSLIAEYKALNDAVWNRGNNNLLIFSIMIPATLTAILFTIEFRTSLGTTFGLPNAGFVPLACLMLIFVSFFELWTSQRIDKICFDRLGEIEYDLRIKGNSFVYCNIEQKPWYFIRSKMWYFVLFLFMAMYGIITWRLFT